MKKCLVLDDNYEIYSILEAGLAESYQLEYAPDPFAAQQMLSQKHYDIVLCDIYMPHMDGFLFASELKKKFKQIPILFMSGSIDPAVVVKAFQIGGCNLVSKPFKFVELLDKMDLAVALHGSQLEVEDEEVQGQEWGYIYNLLKIHYYDTQEILYQIQHHRVPLQVVLSELEKKQRLGKCHLDDPEHIKFLVRGAA